MSMYMYMYIFLILIFNFLILIKILKKAFFAKIKIDHRKWAFVIKKRE